jgi:hypothetical protein
MVFDEALKKVSGGGVRRAENVERQRGTAEDVLVVVHQQISYKAGPGPGVDVTFGRGNAMTVRIGIDDPFMHRRAGSFRWVDGRWELHNDGSRCAMDVEVDGGFDARIAAGADPLILPAGAYGSVHVLTPVHQTLSFATPPAPRPPAPPIDEDDDARESATVGLREALGLSEQETRMLVALCEPRLRNPRLKAYVVPSTGELCARLDINPKRAEDLIDGLATKMARHVIGVIGSNDGRAVTRRHRIAAFALDTRCVTVSDLRLLDPPNGGRAPDRGPGR